MKTQHQILIDLNTRREGDWFYCGGAYCPYCRQYNEVRIQGKRGLGVLDPKVQCEHAVMAVAAGTFDIAVHFTGIAKAE